MRTITRGSFRPQQNVSPAVNALLNPSLFETAEATIVSLAKSGLYANALGVPTFSLRIEPVETPGHTVAVTFQASLAEPASKLTAGQKLSLTGTIHGGLSRGRTPYVLASKFQLKS
jgi:hypothetical protein